MLQCLYCPLLNNRLCVWYLSALVPATITATTQRLTVFNSNPHFQEKGSVYLLLCCESCLKGRMWIIDSFIYFLSLFNLKSVVFYGEITTDFKPCIEFFYAETIPQGISGDGYQALCQHYENQYHFATLYDRNRRIPLLSAYILSPGDGPRPKNTNWMIEPRVSCVKYHCVMFKDSHVFELLSFKNIV